MAMRTSLRPVPITLAAAAVVVLAAFGLPRSHAAPGMVSSQDGPRVTHGVVVGDVTDHSAVLWARADHQASMHVSLSGGPHRRAPAVAVGPDQDFTGQVVLDALRADRTYRYRVWFTEGEHHDARGPVVTGSFRTAPSSEAGAPVRLAFGGDVSGQNVCRDASEGFPIMDTISAWHPDVFVGLGDMIYADNTCGPTGLYGNAQVPGDFGPAVDLPSYWAHWRYNRAELHLQHLLATSDYVGVWDDHEIVNDSGPLTDTRSIPPYKPGVHVLPIALDAFTDYTPIDIAPNTPDRLYRALRWGRNLELIVLDTRQYRDANFAQDSDAAPKTMLGREQLTWLKDTLAASDATWNVIVSSVPMSIPTGFPAANGRDGWANFDKTTGFEHELLDIMRFMQQREIDNTLWITTDVHFGEVFGYTPFPADPSFLVHEMVTGPLNAGIFPTKDFDPTLKPERLFFWGPPSPGDVTDWTQAKHWFNFGAIRIESDGTLTAKIVNTPGKAQFTLTLQPS